jgi:endonuclease/exonuclease/phosphatase family metal-dependent hydrolase
MYLIKDLNNDASAFFYRVTAILDRPYYWYQNKIIENFKIKESIDPYENKNLQKIYEAYQISITIIPSPVILIVLIFLNTLSTITRVLANDFLIADLATKILKINKKNPFTHIRGKRREKELPEDGKISIFNGNICAIDGGGSLIGGGVIDWNKKITWKEDDFTSKRTYKTKRKIFKKNLSKRISKIIPWKKTTKKNDSIKKASYKRRKKTQKNLHTTRLSKITNEILENKPDVICLQEVNSLDAAYFLYKKLKEKYAHFYINIGPQFSSQNSGLFVASKYETDNPNFQNFPKGKGFQQKIVNKGVFGFNLFNKNAESSFLRIFTTHLPPDNKVLRENSMEIIKNQMKKSIYPIMLTGDMNTQFFKSKTSEYFENFKKRENIQFYNCYNDSKIISTKSDSTCNTENQKNYWFGKNPTENPKETIIDYVFILQNIENTSVKKVKPLTSRIIELINFENPQYSLSDHNPIFANVKIPV